MTSYLFVLRGASLKQDIFYVIFTEMYYFQKEHSAVVWISVPVSSLEDTIPQSRELLIDSSECVSQIQKGSERVRKKL